MASIPTEYDAQLKGGQEDGMGEKETGQAMAAGRTRTGNTVSLDDDRGVVRESAETPDEESDDAASAALKTRHDTVKNSIGNIR
ncbi:MAG: hypothetical protein C0506_09075 [Anaerolinea sp.]|nr:hypothetical protein [Anaerolinea sp.]